MLIDNTIYYDEPFIYKLGEQNNNLFCNFDYDSRSYDINMEFQHFHPFYEMHVLLDEAANHIIEGELFHLKKFDIVCLRPSLLHKSEYPEGPAVKRLVIQFDFPALLRNFSPEFDELMGLFSAEIPIYRFDSKEHAKLFEPLNKVYKNTHMESQKLSALFATNCLVEFLYNIFVLKSKNIYSSVKEDAPEQKIYQITSYIHTHFSENLSLERLATLFYISPYHLSHLFHHTTGYTLTNYIQVVRVRNAQQMLLFTNKKVSDISNECGFNSFSQFNRVFNKLAGASPRAYKQSGGKTGMTITPPLKEGKQDNVYTKE